MCSGLQVQTIVVFLQKRLNGFDDILNVLDATLDMAQAHRPSGKECL